MRQGTGMKRRRQLLTGLAGFVANVWLAHGAGAAGTTSGETGQSTPSTDAQPTEEVAVLRREAMRGDVQAQYDLAVALDCGCGVRRDRAEAVEWLGKAADRGHVGAQSALGWKYMTGEGVRRDDKLAFAWLRQAAERGNTSAQNNLGILYAQGRGVEADPAEAERWFRNAADKGAADAQRNLEALLGGRRLDVRPGSRSPLRRT